jgi:hypothetical protein
MAGRPAGMGGSGTKEDPAMTRFACIAIDPEIAARFRATGRDDRGQAVHRMIAPADFAYPCRVCLRYARAGEAVLLGSYNLPKPQGVYWTPSPIFVHAEPCTPFAGEDEVAEIVRRNALVSVRAYDAEGMCLYDLGQVSDGAAVDAPLARALDDGRTSFVNIHTARPGCLLCRVEPVSAAA